MLGVRELLQLVVTFSPEWISWKRAEEFGFLWFIATIITAMAGTHFIYEYSIRISFCQKIFSKVINLRMVTE